MKQARSTEEAIEIIRSFDGLTPAKRRAIFRSLTPAAREELLGVVARPAEITRLISPEETYFSIKALGEEHAPNLVSATTGSQLQFILDVEFWKADMVNPTAVERWLQVLSRISEEKLLHFVQVADPELVITALQYFVRVQARNPDLDIMEEQDSLPPFTLDDVFFLEFKVPDAEEMIKAVLETVFNWDVKRYFMLMEELALGLHSEQEDTALRWRRARLAEHGIPEFDEALEIYGYLHQSRLTGEVPENSAFEPPVPDADLAPALDYPLTCISQENFFRRCLEEIDDSAEQDRLVTELAHLGNKVVIADGKDLGSVEDIQRSLNKVSGYINIALEESCADDLVKGTGVLRANHVEMLFRRGFSLILDLRKEAQHLLRDYEGGKENLGHPLAGMLEGLLRSRPVYASHVLGEKTPREFEFLGDIQFIRGLLDREAIEDRWETI